MSKSEDSDVIICDYLCLRGCAAPTLFYFPFFNFYFGVRDTSIVSNSSIVTSVSGVSSVSIVCSSKLLL